MEAPLPTRQWVLPPSLPQAWLATLQPPSLKPTVPQRDTELPAALRPDGREPVPPIPLELSDRECLYGFIITDGLIDSYCAPPFRNSNDNSDNPYSDFHYRRREYADTAIHRVAERLGLEVYITHLYNHKIIVWFSFSKGGIVQVKEVPIAFKLERFATELGIMENAEWHDAWPNAKK